MSNTLLIVAMTNTTVAVRREALCPRNDKTRWVRWPRREEELCIQG